MNVPDQFHKKLMNLIVFINKKIVKQFEDNYKDVLTTTQFYVVVTLVDYGSMTMSELAEKMGMQKQQATKIANQLTDIGFIDRIYDKNDRRVIKVDVTHKAREFMEQYSIDNIKRISSDFSSLTDKEFDELQSAVETINRIFSHVFIDDGKKT